MSYWATATGSGGASSHVEAELHDVAVADDVVLALGADLADVTSSSPRTGGDELVPLDRLARMKPRWKSVWITPASLRRSGTGGRSRHVIPSPRW